MIKPVPDINAIRDRQRRRQGTTRTKNAVYTEDIDTLLEHIDSLSTSPKAAMFDEIYERVLTYGAALRAIADGQTGAATHEESALNYRRIARATLSDPEPKHV